MSKKTWTVFGSIVLVIMLAIVVLSVALGGCTGMLELANGNTTFMKCHWTFVSMTIAASAGALIALCSIFCKTKEARRMGAISVLILLAAVVVLPSPLGIGVCASLDMHCHMTVWATCGLAAVAAFITIAQLIKADPKAAELPKMEL